MTIAYFDCFSGISGDMALGALLDCGVPLEALRAGLASLPAAGWDIEAIPILQHGMHAMDVRIALHGESDEEELQRVRQSAVDGPDGPPPEPGPRHDHDHNHGHAHHRDHTGHNDGHPGHDRAQSYGHGRSLAEICSIIEASQLSEWVKQTSLAIFGRIAAAEAHIHHTTPDNVHFHEIGGIDSLIDICGVAWCLEYLNIGAVYCSALPHSTGFVDCAHGRVPVPAPATLELLKGVPLVPADVRGELVTPTGAGIVVALSRGFGPPPAMTLERTGVGSGKKRFEDRPNILRVLLGQPLTAARPTERPDLHAPGPQQDGLEWKNFALVETNVDDMNPELFQYVFKRLFGAGAVDVWLQPIQMKKNRPAWLLAALCPSEAQNTVVATVLQETTTLGVRVTIVDRAALPRAGETVETRFGTVRIKIARWPEQGLWRGAPEYDDVERLATQHSVPVREVYEAAAAVMRATLRPEPNGQQA